MSRLAIVDYPAHSTCMALYLDSCFDRTGCLFVFIYFYLSCKIRHLSNIQIYGVVALNKSELKQNLPADQNFSSLL